MNLNHIHFPEFIDDRGRLIVFEEDNLPFKPVRTFIIKNVPFGKTRANHAINCDLVLYPVTGSLCVNLDKGHKEIELSANLDNGLYIKEGTFIILKEFSEDAVTMVLASKSFKDTKYFLNLDEHQSKR